MQSETKTGALLVLLAGLFTAACGGGKDDDDGPSLRWQCYSIATDDSCECYGLEPGATMDYGGTGISDVDECDGYEVCMSYFDSSFEGYRCDCGGADFMPMGDPEDITDIEMVQSCPDE